MVWKSTILLIASVFLSVQRDADRLTMKAAIPSAIAPQAANTTLFLCGDVMTGRGIDQVLPSSVEPVIYEPYVKDAREYVRIAENKNGSIPKKASYSYIWGDALEVWEQYAPELKIINLETSITTHDEHWAGKGIQYRMHPDNVAVLTAAAIDFSSLANNHVLDWKRPGLQETLQTLHKAGIAYAGAGQDLQEARKPAILKTSTGRVIVISYAAKSSGIPEGWDATSQRSGINLLPDFSVKTVTMIKEQVRQVKKAGDVVVFSVHWGGNWGYDIPAHQRDFARQLIEEAGVDIIHGHSSHHPQGMEVYKDKLIIYGAGDFINDYEGIGGHEAYRGDLSLMYFPQVNPVSGKLTSLKMVPMQIRNFRLNHASSSDAKWLARVLDRESQKFGTRVKRNDDNTLSLSWQ